MVNWNFLSYLISAFLITIIIVGIIDRMFISDCNRWHPANHCDALCTGKYGSGEGNDWHILGVTVIDIKVPFSTGEYNKYMCICSGGNITTSWTCM